MHLSELKLGTWILLNWKLTLRQSTPYFSVRRYWYRLGRVMLFVNNTLNWSAGLVGAKPRNCQPLRPHAVPPAQILAFLLSVALAITRREVGLSSGDRTCGPWGSNSLLTILLHSRPSDARGSFKFVVYLRILVSRLFIPLYTTGKVIKIFSLLSFKSRLMRSPYCQCGCESSFPPPLLTLEWLSQSLLNVVCTVHLDT